MIRALVYSSLGLGVAQGCCHWKWPSSSSNHGSGRNRMMKSASLSKDGEPGTIESMPTTKTTEKVEKTKEDGEEKIKKRCLRCQGLYLDSDNSPTACSFHGHATGEKGLFALAPPHQGIDGEWSDQSGVIVYRWNEKQNRPNTGSGNWKRRWSCCQEYGEDAPPCRRGYHVSYDDGFTLY